AAVDRAGRVVIAKCASTPRDPSEGLMEGLGLLASELGLDLPDLLARTEAIVHGTTVATNAPLERKGARVGLLTTEGHRAPTVVNAYVGPALARYLGRLAAELRARGYRGDVLVMQSHGGVAPVRESARLAAGAVLSGPAGGVAAGRYAARLLAEGNLITFDMGGTSTDIALLQRGEPQLTGEKRVGIARVALPALDIHTLGAGGGSVAWVDPGRILHVGPESAGADPGPACYAKGGARATVTDANLVLGYLGPGNFLGGRIPLDAAAAQGALAEVARRLGTSVLTAAEGVSRVVSTNMAEGIKIVSVRRGVDPRRFALVAFGGAAGLHVTEVARLLEIRRVVVPSVAAVLYAYSAPGQEVVIVNARVAVVGELPVLPAETAAASRRVTAGPARRRVWLGDWIEVPVYRMDTLPAGHEVKGPAILESATTTVLVREGERVTVTPHGWLDIRIG